NVNAFLRCWCISRFARHLPAAAHSPVIKPSRKNLWAGLLLFLRDLNRGRSLCIEILRHAFLPWLIRRDCQGAFLNFINRFACLPDILGNRTFRNRRDELSRRDIFGESECSLVPIVSLSFIAEIEILAGDHKYNLMLRTVVHASALPSTLHR